MGYEVDNALYYLAKKCREEMLKTDPKDLKLRAKILTEHWRLMSDKITKSELQYAIYLETKAVGERRRRDEKIAATKKRRSKQK